MELFRERYDGNLSIDNLKQWPGFENTTPTIPNIL